MSGRDSRGEIALVTGANKGIGREVVRRLAAEGLTVYLGSRDADRGLRAARELAGADQDVRFLQLDVTDDDQVEAAAAHIEAEFGLLDVLVNNAGVAIEWDSAVTEVTAQQMRETFAVNVFGVVAVTRACIPLLRRSTAARIVNLSSPLGSLHLLGDRTNPVSRRGLLAYSSSKSAVNAVTVLYASALRADGITVNAVSPGFVATDLNSHAGHLTVEQGAQIPVTLALHRSGGSTGTFVGPDDRLLEQSLPW